MKTQIQIHPPPPIMAKGPVYPCTTLQWLHGINTNENTYTNTNTNTNTNTPPTAYNGQGTCLSLQYTILAARNKYKCKYIYKLNTNTNTNTPPTAYNGQGTCLSLDCHCAMQQLPDTNTKITTNTN